MIALATLAPDLAIDRAMAAAKDLAMSAFDPERLNADSCVAVRDREEVGELLGWDGDAQAWEVRTPSKGTALVPAGDVADVYEIKGFTDFLLGIRGRLMDWAGDKGPADEAARFERFIKAGGVFAAALEER